MPETTLRCCRSFPVIGIRSDLWFGCHDLPPTCFPVQCGPAVTIGRLAARLRRWAGAVATGVFLALSAFPFVVLFPQPPAFGRSAAGIAAAFAILAPVGTAYRTGQIQRTRIVRRSASLFAVTAAALLLQMLLAGRIAATIPTMDVLPQLFGLQGEDMDDAILYEAWVEIWLGCALLPLLATGLRRAIVRGRLTQAAGAHGPWSEPPRAGPTPPWNAATILLWFVGWAALCAAVLDGHWTASFLSNSVHVTGTTIDQEPHPRIRFTAANGAVIEFTQNGYVSRPLGADVPVAYQTQDPARTARADTFWANWSEVLGFAWIGLGFTLAPFYGFRGAFRAGRW